MRRGGYTLALRALAPLLWLFMWRRARRTPGQWEILGSARFGHVPSAVLHDDAPVWVHAVSLGETRAAQPLIQGLLDAGLPVLLTHMTATGRAEGARLFEAAIARGQLRQTWLPYDFPASARRFIAAVRPRCGLIVEREIWPNVLAEASAAGVPLALVNARFSPGSLRRARRQGTVMREALGRLDRVLAQTADDAARLAEAGAHGVQVTGNLKFDLTLPPALLAAGRDWRVASTRPVIVIASTREGEDAMFAAAIAAARARSRALFVLIPRHPHRFDEAAAHLEGAGLRCVRRSQAPQVPGDEIDVVVGDSLGEMPFYYASADVAIVAGSFAPFGGHNLIEACAAGTPVIVGPHTHNFEQAVADAIEAGAAERAADAAAAVTLALDWVQDAPARARRAQAAQAWTAAHAGAVKRTLAALADWLGPERPSGRPSAGRPFAGRP
ncbi:3-deoxy-D-manno-octulosonic acid transferase [Bordetella genomosp. 1]|uniref:3-deoxy-D-manno-octulosonic acid transferase n=1 Tax=Bordetella genomosp. 1 TaxID=1395607 RepID=A0A261RV18_9BORD|nr:3-deoxy-D-manno-octulosonic acid transferase [Bordetella genomosp. 1]OZI28133.1 3-deoxy-D-manno-octulosonic acid transferase [Bordetella genomosp. 1]